MDNFEFSRQNFKFQVRKPKSGAFFFVKMALGEINLSNVALVESVWSHTRARTRTCDTSAFLSLAVRYQSRAGQWDRDVGRRPWLEGSRNYKRRAEASQTAADPQISTRRTRYSLWSRSRPTCVRSDFHKVPFETVRAGHICCFSLCWWNIWRISSVFSGIFWSGSLCLVPTDMEYTSSPKPQLSSRANAFSIAALMSSGKSSKDKDTEESTIKPLGKIRPQKCPGGSFWRNFTHKKLKRVKKNKHHQLIKT